MRNSFEDYTFKEGDKVVRKDGTTFSNKSFVTTVDRLDGAKIWLKETKTYTTESHIKLKESNMFKEGDKVRITGNTNSSVNSVGDIGVVVSEKSLYGSYKVFVYGRGESCNWTKPHEMELVGNVTKTTNPFIETVTTSKIKSVVNGRGPDHITISMKVNSSNKGIELVIGHAYDYYNSGNLSKVGLSQLIDQLTGVRDLLDD